MMQMHFEAKQKFMEKILRFASWRRTTEENAGETFCVKHNIVAMEKLI